MKPGPSTTPWSTNPFASEPRRSTSTLSQCSRRLPRHSKSGGSWRMPTTSSLFVATSLRVTRADRVCPHQIFSLCLTLSNVSFLSVVYVVSLKTLHNFLRSVNFSFYYRDDTLLSVLKTEGAPFFTIAEDRVVQNQNIAPNDMKQIRHLVRKGRKKEKAHAEGRNKIFVFGSSRSSTRRSSRGKSVTLRCHIFRRGVLSHSQSSRAT